MPQTILGQYAALLPTGTTAQRPSGQSGYIRYNTTTNALEFYSSLNWETISTEKISNLTTHGGNAFAILKGGKVFTTHGSSGGFNYYLTGRGPDGSDPYFGVDTGLKEVPIPSASPITKMFKCGDNCMGVLLEDGSLYLWGLNSHGECGNSLITAVPYPYLAATGVAAVWSTIGGNDYGSSGTTSIIFKKTSDSRYYGLGGNSNGQLGIGSTTNQTTPTLITALAANSVVNIFILGSYGVCTFVENSDGTIWACGYNTTGNLGITLNTAQQTSFQNVTTNWGGNLSGGSIMKMCQGAYYHDGSLPYSAVTILMLRKTAAGVTSIYTCGASDYGALGNGTTTPDISTPFHITTTGSNAVADVAMFGGSRKTCQYLTTAGALYAWGYNGYGQVGNGTTTNQTTPIEISSPSAGQTVIKLFSDQQCGAGTGQHKTQSFIKTSDKKIWGCGWDDDIGYLGSTATTGVANSYSSTYIRVSFPPNANIVEMGSFLTTNGGRIQVALSDKNNLYVWGYNLQYGVTALSTTSPQLPTQVSAIPPSG